MRHLMTVPRSHAVKVTWHAMGRPSDGCATSPGATAPNRLLPRIELRRAGLGTAAANAMRSGPIPNRCCRPLHGPRK